ncbi:MAG: hypothetical protein HWE25_15820 [Alphaproteobacteria bacterium]|nr:hypothetical protein [Alphaproteobacteria bacterium]
MPDNTKPAWPQNAMVGYIDMQAAGSMAAITAGQIQAYNVIVLSFANADGTVDPGLMSAVAPLLQEQAAGTLNLLSYGGEGAGAQLTPTTAQNLVASAQQYDLDGIDLDIEDNSITVADYAAFVAALRAAMNNDLLLTMAPILAGAPNAPTLNIPNGGVSLEPIYSQPGFDAVLVQAYNSGPSFTYPLPSDPSQQVGEDNANIISAAYDALQQNGDVNLGTKIVIGIPANAGGAPTASNVWDVADHSSVPPLVGTNLHDIASGSYGIDPEQFGGLMTWSLNTDADPSAFPGYNGFQNGPAGYFAENVAPMMTGLQAGSAQAAE